MLKDASEELSANIPIEQKIASLLERKHDSRISVLDGEWGVGKTFFVKNTLKRHLSKGGKENVFYISLLDVESVRSFESKLIFAAVEPKLKKGRRFVTAYDSITKITSAFNKATGALLSASRDLARQALSSHHVKDAIFIVDDLDRIDEEQYPKLQASIATKSLFFRENSEGVRILFVVNMKKVHLNEDQKEKFFLPSVQFKLPFSEVNSIMAGFIKDRCESHLMRNYGVDPFLKKIKEMGKFYNLRVLKDCALSMDAFLNLFQSILSEYDYDEVESLPCISEAFLSLYYSHLCFGASEVEIKKAMSVTYLEMIAKEKYHGEVMQQREQRVMESLINFGGSQVLADENLFNFCFNGADFNFKKYPVYHSTKGSFPSLLNFHKWPETMTGEECDKTISRIEDYVFNKNQEHPPRIHQWATMAKEYTDMVKLFILPKPGAEDDIIQLIPSMTFNMDGVKVDDFDEGRSRINHALKKRVVSHYEESALQFANLIRNIHSDASYTPPNPLGRNAVNFDVMEVMLEAEMKMMVKDFKVEQLVKLKSLIAQASRRVAPCAVHKDAFTSFLQELLEEEDSVQRSIAIFNIIDNIRDVVARCN